MSFGLAILVGFAMVFVIEGLVLALFPARVEDALRLIAEIPTATRRLLGLAAVALGVAMAALVLSGL
ncbi:MAG: DUF2065 family protein [Roseicyclus sp.]